MRSLVTFAFGAIAALLAYGAYQRWAYTSGSSTARAVADARWRKSINSKVDKYLRFAKANPETWLYVLFATYPGKLASTAGKRANDLLAYLEERGLTRGQFLVTTVDRACSDPMGKVFGKPGSSEFPLAAGRINLPRKPYITGLSLRGRPRHRP